MIKTYLDLIELPTFEERFNYLLIKGRVGEATFGAERYLNQILYNSYDWKRIRRKVILRDNGCDLGIAGREIPDKRYVRIHHINPLTKEQILNRDPCLFDLNNLITCLDKTHQAIHYTGWDGVYHDPIIREPNDTSPWRKHAK